MKKGIVLFLLILNLISLATSQEISLNYPNQVRTQEEFNLDISLNNFSESVYDVKIEIKNGTKNIAQKFWGNQWKSTYYWMYGAINTSKENSKTFRMKITEDYKGVAALVVKIKNSKIEKEFSGYQISVARGSGENNNTNQENNTDNENHTTDEGNSDTSEAEISLEMNWNDEDIVNGDEFDMELKAFNLKGKEYDVRVWIEFRNNETVISERYDEELKEWKSGRYYVNNFFNGPGNKTKEIILRINKDHEDFKGEARIYFKLRDGKEINRIIEVLEKENKEEEKKEDSNVSSTDEDDKTTAKKAVQPEKNSTDKITGGVIRLGSLKTSQESTDKKTESIKTKSSIVYESENELIKKYSVVALAILIVALGILIILKKS